MTTPTNTNKFKNNIFAASFEICRKFPLLVFAVLIAGYLNELIKIQYQIKEWPALVVASSIVVSIVNVLLVFNAYSFSLSANISTIESPIDRFKRFIWRYMVVVAFFSFLAALQIYKFKENIHYFYHNIDEALGILILLQIVTRILAYTMYSLVGTWIPAGILNENADLRSSLSRGLQSFKWTFVRLLAGPGLIFVGLNLLPGMFLLIAKMKPIMQDSQYFYLFSDVFPPIYFFIADFLLTPLSALMTSILTVVIVSRAFLMSREAGE